MESLAIPKPHAFSTDFIENVAVFLGLTRTSWLLQMVLEYTWFLSSTDTIEIGLIPLIVYFNGVNSPPSSVTDFVPFEPNNETVGDDLRLKVCSGDEILIGVLLINLIKYSPS